MMAAALTSHGFPFIRCRIDELKRRRQYGGKMVRRFVRPSFFSHAPLLASPEKRRISQRHVCGYVGLHSVDCGDRRLSALQPCVLRRGPPACIGCQKEHPCCHGGRHKQASRQVIVSCRNNGKSAASCSTCDPPRSATHPPTRRPKLATSSPSSVDLQHHFVQGNSAIFHMCARRFSWFTRMQSYFPYWQVSNEGLTDFVVFVALN
nr:uncharacterized protein LOC127324193 isoform X2 [Lolium perenne]